MGLKLMRDGGRVRRAWYGQYKDGGRYRAVRLTTPMRGERIPSSLAGVGDSAFERSRALAQAEFERFEAERRVKGGAAHLTEALINNKTGRAVEYVTVSGLEAAWRKLHPRDRSEKQESNIAWFFRLFADSVGARRRFCYEVTAEDATAFYSDIRGRFAWSTARRIMHLLKGAFADALPSGAVNPFTRVELVAKDGGEAVHRRPLSDGELARLVEEAKSDPMLHSLVVAASCTGMRIGDICNLKWSSVDLAAGLVGAVTRKTGAEVYVPILAPFRAVLEGALAEAEDGEAYVFPEAARLYRYNYAGLIRKGKVLFARALFAEEARREAVVADADGAAEKSPAEVLAVIRSVKWGDEKREKVERVYSLYASGLSYRAIERETGYSRGQISQYLHLVEKIAGVSVVKFAERCAVSGAALVRKTRMERRVGRHAASLYGWHSLRASFVVSALNCGVPLEVVRRIVGHTTTDMTLEYFNPTKRIMAEAVRRRMDGTAIGGVGAAGAAFLGAALPSAPVALPSVQGAASGGLEGLVSRLSADERARLRALLG